MTVAQHRAIADRLIARCSAECAGDRADVFHTLVVALVNFAVSHKGCAPLLGIAIETLTECQKAAIEAARPFTEAS